MSARVSNARYGLTAPAPYPMSNAKCATSRGSPDSTRIPTLVRVPSLIRWWCTPAVASKLGIGAFFESTPRSERIRIEQPSSIARDAASHSSSIALRIKPAELGSNSVDNVLARMPLTSIALIFSISSLVRTGSVIVSWRECSGVSSNRFCSQPIIALVDVTSSSRIASSGGLLTWAKSCLK